MSLAAMGCNPTHKGQSASDIGDVALGTLAFSPDGGLYVAIKAGEGISQYACCLIDGGWDIRNFDLSDDDDDNASLCLPQVALSNNDYGWGLVWGNGFGIADAAIGAGAPLYPTDDAGKLDDTAQTTILFTGLYSSAAQGTADAAVAVNATFPKAVAIG